MTMRLASKARENAALPEGYQFGDMGDPLARLSDEQKFAHYQAHYVRPATYSFGLTEGECQLLTGMIAVSRDLGDEA